MSRLGWLGLPLFSSTPEPKKVGIVLSGGGARASFQLGVLRYLYSKTDIAPNVFVGTSAGAIIASMLAQFSNRSDQANGIIVLEQLWRDLTSQSDMYIERSWFSKLRTHSERILEVLAAEPRQSWFRSVPLPLPWLSRKTETPSEESDSEPTELDPLAIALSPESPSEGDWSPGLLIQVFSHLGLLSRAGGDIPSIWQDADRTRSAYRPGPLLARLLDPSVFLPERVYASGVVLRIAMVGLGSGQLRFMREDGILVNRHNEPITDTCYDLSLGVLASCAIPAVFAPVRIGEETYVDGGVRENLPAEMAIGHLGTNPTYVIASAPDTFSPETTSPATDVISIMMRSMNILSDESLRDEMAYAQSAGAIIIQPEIEVHDSLTVVPELIAINLDYGWIRAAETVLGCAVADEALHRKLIQLRLDLYHARNQTEDSDELKTATQVSQIQEKLREAINQSQPQFLPQGWHTWAD